MFGSSPPPLLIGKKTEDEEQVIIQLMWLALNNGIYDLKLFVTWLIADLKLWPARSVDSWLIDWFINLLIIKDDSKLELQLFFCLLGPQQDDTGLFSESKATPQSTKTEVKPPPASQPSKAKSGGGLFSDEDEEEGGGLFGTPAAKPQPKAEVTSRPKTKTTISLFDDDEQDEEDDFFAAPAASKANR